MSTKVAQHVADALITRGETVAVAESVTAGLITAALSGADNATKFLQGGMIVYNLGQKTRHLGIDPIHAEETNCVSQEVAIQMARAVAEKFCSHWGVAITGYAAPVPQLKIRSCFAYYAITRKGEPVISSRVDSDPAGQRTVQLRFVSALLRDFHRILGEQSA